MQNQHSVTDEIRGVLLFVSIIWIVFILDLFLPLERLALLPRSISGIPGIVAMPFLHGNWSHLIANSTPLVVLLMLLAGSRANSIKVIFLIVVIGGSLHWLAGREVYVVGASGLVFGLISYLFLAGLFERRFVPLAIGLFVGFTYGATLFTGVLPNQPGISWDGHLFGAIGGALAAFLLTRNKTN